MNPGAAGQGRRSCHRLSVCHCCSPTKKNKKTKKNLYTYISHNIIKLVKTITILNSQNNIILLLFQTQNPPPPFGWHLQHPIWIFIFNTHFASSSSIPIWHLQHPILHLHLQHPFGIILKHPILYHQPV